MWNMPAGPSRGKTGRTQKEGDGIIAVLDHRPESGREPYEFLLDRLGLGVDHPISHLSHLVRSCAPDVVRPSPL